MVVADPFLLASCACFLGGDFITTGPVLFVAKNTILGFDVKGRQNVNIMVEIAMFFKIHTVFLRFTE